ncbi:pilus assembly protein TadG-related protein [Streptomyces endophyticus]|uniref:Putative Flp pilus-assembly TadG-like N-terminal domain-containing protein n=1 Tax=Streptomyces endophyticus TaxID=714166 RepID=A0ABU6F2H7_9ACTN|nr:pilus assembly protein TadG-related protein [Streptomyces endophyticus]MEB8338044.1 hypothetical protein [Streptomyces endophyticus]
MTPSPLSAVRPCKTMRRDEGQATVFVVLITVAVLMFAGLVLDGGLALAAKVRAIGEAQEAARRGAQALDLSAYRADGTLRLIPDQARDLAQRHLAATGDTGTVTATGDTVTVRVSARSSAQLLRVVGIQSFTVSASGSAHPVRNIGTAVP